MDDISKAISLKMTNAAQQGKRLFLDSLLAVLAMKPTDDCWCASGRKYASCHMERATERKVSSKEDRDAQTKAFERQRVCCADFDKANCRLPIIGAHTVQRSRVLASFSEAGHVGTFYRSITGEDILAEPSKSGVRKQASVFFGFCSYHDTELFKEIEITDFVSTSENCWASSYRAVCHEFYQKNAAKLALAWKRDNIDKGRVIHEQIVIQDALKTIYYSVAKGERDASRLKREYEDIHLRRSYGEVRSFILEMSTPLVLAASGTVSPIYDLAGMKIQSFASPGHVEHFSISTVVRQQRAVYVISNLTKDIVAGSYLDAVMSMGHEFIKSWLYKVIVAYLENCYFSLSWWDNLSTDDQGIFSAISGDTHYDEALPTDDSIASLIPGKLLSVNSI